MIDVNLLKEELADTQRRLSHVPTLPLEERLDAETELRREIRQIKREIRAVTECKAH